MIAYDNHELSNWKDCYRKGYLRHERKWTGVRTAYPLIYGICIHSSADAIWRSAHTPGDTKADAFDKAMFAFRTSWVEEGLPPEDSAEYIELLPDLKFRTIENAERILLNYIDQRWERLQSLELLGIERPFEVPLTPTLSYIGVIDKIIREHNQVAGIEHKTSSNYRKDGGFSPDFLDDFFPNSQVEGYLYAIRYLYEDIMAMIYIDAILVHKEVSAFNLLPINPPPDAATLWIQEVSSFIQRIEQARQLYREGEWTLETAFPRNDSKCIGRYGRCEFLDICRFVPRPDDLEEPPQAYKVDEWIPYARKVNQKEFVSIQPKGGE